LTLATTALPLSAESLLIALARLRPARAPRIAILTITVGARVLIESLPTTGLPYRKVGQLPLGRLALGSRERGANKAAMHRPFVFGHRLAFGVGGNRPLDVDGHFLTRRRGRRVVHARLGPVVVVVHDATGIRRRRMLECRCALFLALRRDARLLVFMIRIAGRAARLLHLIVDHGDDGVIGDTSLAWTIVIDDVTEPKPALLHEALPEVRILSGGEVGIGTR
jgi:hypothetical protein